MTTQGNAFAFDVEDRAGSRPGEGIRRKVLCL